MRENQGWTAGDVLELVRSGRADTRSELGRVTGLSRTAVGARVATLVDNGWLVPGDERPSTGGRPPAGLRLNAPSGLVGAVAIGRSRVQVGLFDLAGDERGSRSDEIEVGTGPDALMPQIVERLAALLDEHGDGARLLAVGLSLPGTVDADRGASLDAPVLRGWDGVALVDHFAPLGDVPVLLGNDADVLARSERIEGHAEVGDLLVLKASTGLGLGVVVGRRVVAGRLGAAGEIGHTWCPAAGDRPCRCGARGCLETVAAGWALVAAMDRPDVRHVRDLVALATSGDPEARALLRESGRRVGEVLAVAVNLLNPHGIVVGGDMAAAYDTFAAGLRETLYLRAAPLATRGLEILPATHGARSGLVGCAALALDHVLSAVEIDRRLAAATATSGGAPA